MADEIMTIPEDLFRIDRADQTIYYYTYNGIYSSLGDYAYVFLIFLTFIGVSILKKNMMIGALFSTILFSLITIFGSAGFLPLTPRFYTYSAMLYLLMGFFIAVNIARRRT